MTFDPGIWPLTAWTYEGSHILSINQVWFQSDFNFLHEATFTFSAYFKTWPQMTFDPGIWPLTAWTYEGSHVISINQVWFQSDFNFSNETIFTCSAYFTTWPQMTFDPGIWPLTAWTYEGSHILSINQVWFQSDFNFLHEATFTFSAYFKTWPQMTFDPGIWPLTAWTYEGSHVISINQVWFQSDFQLFTRGHFHIFSLSYNVTSDDLWPWMQPLTSTKNRVLMLHLWPNVGWNPSKHMEVKAKC